MTLNRSLLGFQIKCQAFINHTRHVYIDISLNQDMKTYIYGTFLFFSHKNLDLRV